MQLEAYLLLYTPRFLYSQHAGAQRKAVQGLLQWHTQISSKLSLSQVRNHFFIAWPFFSVCSSQENKLNKATKDQARRKEAHTWTELHATGHRFAPFWIQNANGANETAWMRAKKSVQRGEPASKAHPRNCWHVTGNHLCNLVVLEPNCFWWALYLFRIQDENNLSEAYYSAPSACWTTQLKQLLHIHRQTR